MSFAQQVARTAQRPIQQAARSFSSHLRKAPSLSKIVTSTAEEGGMGWLQADGEREYPDVPAFRDAVQQDHGQLDIFYVKDSSNFKPKNALKNALDEAREQMQEISYNSGTVGAGVLMTEEALTLYSCGDCTVALLFPNSKAKDGAPIVIRPPSGEAVKGKNGAVLRVGGTSAIESKYNFPTVEPVPQLEKVYMDQYQELAKEHGGAAMALVVSDGLHTKDSFNDFDFEKLKFHMLKDDKLYAKQQMFDAAARAGNSDNKTMYLDYVPEDLQNRLVNVAIFDGHGRQGAAVAQSVAKSTITEIEKEVIRSQHLSPDEKGFSR